MKVEEIWREVANYEGEYEVSNMGRVRSLKSNLVLKPRHKGKNYWKVRLYKEGVGKEHSIHRLVASTFISPIPQGMVVNHKDENPANNCVENLEICSYHYNNHYASAYVRRAKSMAIAKSKAVKLRNCKTDEVLYFESGKAASQYFNKGRTVVPSLIYQAKNNGKNKVRINGEEYYFSSNKSLSK
jgi:hypothetical protein